MYGTKEAKMVNHALEANIIGNSVPPIHVDCFYPKGYQRLQNDITRSVLNWVAKLKTYL